jgi:hypothetical protein
VKALSRNTAAAVPSPALNVPASLHASLMARLDRLRPARELAQIGAAIGRGGYLTQARAHLDRAIALHDPAAHRPLATRFGQDVLVITLRRRSMVLWTLGYPDAAVADTDHALSDAREIGHAATLLIGFIAPIWTRL